MTEHRTGAWFQNNTSPRSLSLLALGTTYPIYWPRGLPDLSFGTRGNHTSLRLHLRSTGVYHLLWRTLDVHIPAAYFLSYQRFLITRTPGGFILPLGSGILTLYSWAKMPPTENTKHTITITYERSRSPKTNLLTIHALSLAATPLPITISDLEYTLAMYTCTGFA